MSAASTTSTLTSTTMPNSTTLSGTGVADDTSTDNWMSTTPRIVFLTVFISFGFVGNLFLMITICQSRRFRSVTFFVFVVNLAATNMCECLLNMSLLMASSVLNEWQFGDIACRMSSFFLHLVCNETILALTVTTADRFVAVRFKEKYDQVVSTPRIAICITFTWIQASAFSFPIAIGAVATSVNNFIFYCSISEGSSHVFTTISALLCFIVPLALMIVFFVKIIRTGYKDRYLNRNLDVQHRSFNSDAGEEPRFKQEFRNSNITGTLCVAWVILQGPHVVSSYYSRFTEGSGLDRVSTEENSYVWYVDLVLLWLRFSYAMVLPIAAFTWSKELWKCFKDFILCRKNNAVIDESFKKADSDTLRLERKIREEKLKDKESMMVQPREQRVFQVPVLFATSHGVHIKTFDQNEVSDNDTDETSKKGTWRGKKCDVEGSRDNLNNFEDDTSDYDSGSELDPFSVSHPVSASHLRHETKMIERKRSLSEPEFRDKKGMLIDHREPDTVCETSNGDSGVDLNTSHQTNTCKSTFHVPCDKLMLQTTQLLQTELLDEDKLAQAVHGCPQSDSGNMYAQFPQPETTRPADDITCDTDQCIEPGLNYNTNICLTKGTDTATLSSISESPLPKRKKKKRKEKPFDTQSMASLTSNSILPPRPPARLAPITNNLVVNSLQTGPGRPGSSCSNQCSMLDNNMDGCNAQYALTCDSCSDLTKADIMSFDNRSVSSFNMHRCANKVEKSQSSATLADSNMCNKAEGTSLQLDCKRDIGSVPEEVLTPSDCHVHTQGPSSEPLHLPREAQQQDYSQTMQGNNIHHAYDTDHTQSGITNEGYEPNFDTNVTTKDADVTPVGRACNVSNKCRNVEARRKRRDKLCPQPLYNDGYQRLVPDTP